MAEQQRRDVRATEDDRPYVWVDVGHVHDAHLADPVRVQNGRVAVYADTGALVNPQPDYPPQPDPDQAPGEVLPDEPSPKSTAK